MKKLAAILLCTLFACETKNDGRITAATSFTERFSKSRFATWHVRARAAGDDCGVLLVETSMIMDESMIEALHYGAGAYDVIRGGVQQFSRERAFRGVVYRDPSLRTWTYGATNALEADTLRPAPAPLLSEKPVSKNDLLSNPLREEDTCKKCLGGSFCAHVPCCFSS